MIRRIVSNKRVYVYNDEREGVQETSPLSRIYVY